MRATGDEVELLADDDRPGGWLLLLDRVRQSYVDLHDPTYLERLARECIGMVMPGEVPFAIVTKHGNPKPARC